MLHLAAANGFTPQLYRRLLDMLTQPYRVLSAPFAPLTPGRDPLEITRWQQLADELRLSLRAAGAGQILGVGHSVGAVISMLAAADDPGLFSALVLIDPVIFTGTRSFFWKWLKRLGLMSKFPLVSRAARRRARWNSREEILANYADKPFFKRWAEGFLQDYLDHGLLCDDDDCCHLRYSPAWEARIFATAPHSIWRELRRLEIPVLLIRGQNSDAFLADAAQRFVHIHKDADLRIVQNASHLVPMEQPQRVAALIDDFISRFNSA